MSGQESGLEPVKVFADLSNKINATKTHFGEYSSGVSKLLKLKARPAGFRMGKPPCLQMTCQLTIQGLIQDEIFSQAVTRTPVTAQQLTNMAVVSSSLFLRYAFLLAVVRSLCASRLQK